MNIEFERTEEDLVEFNLFHLSHSPSMRKQILIVQIVIGVLGFILFMGLVVLWYLNAPVRGSYVVLAVFCAVVGFAYPQIYKTSVVRQTRKMLKEGDNKSLLGHHKMSLSQDGIFYRMPASESKLDWSSVGKVLQTEKYIFIYIGALSALVVPKSAFASLEKQKDFLDFVNSNAGQMSKAS